MAVIAVASAVCMVDASTATIDNVVVRMGLPEGQGLSGVCLFRNRPGNRRHIIFKSVTSARKKHGSGGDYMVAGDLAADRVYEGTFARLEDGDQVARFECKGGQRFEIATPFVVPERDLDTMLTVKESMERRFGAQPSRQQPRRFVTADHVSITLRVLQRRTPTAAVDTDDYVDDDASVTVDVFQLYKKPTAPGNLWNSKTTSTAAQYSAFPFARYALRYPIGKLMLDDLPPDQMLAIKLRRPVTVNNNNNNNNDNLTENAIFVYTGGLYPRGTANLTRMLDDEPTQDEIGTATNSNNDAVDIDVSATSLQILYKHMHHDPHGKRPE